MLKRLLVSTILILFVSVTAFAHEVFVVPAKFDIKKGETVKLDVYSTHYFIETEEMENSADLTLTLIQNGKNTSLKMIENKKREIIESSLTLPEEGAAIIAAHRVGQVWSETTKGWQQGDKKTLEAKKFNVLKTSKYEKFTKTFINSSKSDKSFSQNIGQVLEITPITNPADMKVGEYAEFKVTYNNKPISLPILATYAGFTDIGDTYAYYTNNSENGVFKVKILSKGTWIVRANLIEKSGDEAYDVKSIIVFEVK